VLGTVKYGIRATSSTFDPYGPRINANLGKFIVADFNKLNMEVAK
jgi:hypothetical protein